jgi:predicted transcriptional regulator
MEKSEMAVRTLTPKEIALDWGTTGKTLRKFLRSDKALGSLAPGKGGRWAIPANSLKSARKRFDAWKQAQALEAQKRREEAASTDSPETDTDDNEVEVLEEDEVIEVLNDDEVDEISTNH